jgi:3-hydroxyacyl-CoA dehydrogenase
MYYPVPALAKYDAADFAAPHLAVDEAYRMAKVKASTSYEEATKDIDIAIEALPETMDLKKKIFAQLDSVAPAKAVLASNTSALSITEMGKATKRPDKVAGMHFFNPPHSMALAVLR